MIYFVLLVLLGFFVGFIGSLVGLGGGFILVPIFLLAYPDKSPEVITGMSLTVILFNSISGSISYISQRRVALQVGIVMSIFSIPGTIIGSYVLKYIPKNIFSIIFSIFIIALGISFFFKSTKQPVRTKNIQPNGNLKYVYTDKDNNQTTYCFKLLHIVIFGLVGGILSSILGIGGGIIYLPALIYIFGLPVSVAAATSLFATSLTAFSGSFQHFITGSLNNSILQIILIAAGVIIGSQIGARFSAKLSSKTLSRIISIILIVVAIRLIFSNI